MSGNGKRKGLSVRMSLHCAAMPRGQFGRRVPAIHPSTFGRGPVLLLALPAMHLYHPTRLNGAHRTNPMSKTHGVMVTRTTNNKRRNTTKITPPSTKISKQERPMGPGKGVSQIILNGQIMGGQKRAPKVAKIVSGQIKVMIMALQHRQGARDLGVPRGRCTRMRNRGLLIGSMRRREKRLGRIQTDPMLVPLHRCQREAFTT
mmetsp:Transcript_20713/g.46690  ORF Transcript_20713/g.46690 Transcript_20713/m.46690 type:complete len:203 (+) Transcript_20713:2038-2646(+)